MAKWKVGEIEEDVGTCENPFSTIAPLKLIFNPRTYIYIYKHERLLLQAFAKTRN